jgi:PAS domain S-box-containing protein
LVSERTAELLVANSELAQEVKARKELERSLREREEHYRNIIEIAQEGIIVVDAAGVITFANTMMETILGIGHDKIVGMHFSDFVQDDRRQFVSAQLQMREGGVSGKYEIELISAGDAPVYVLVSSTPLYGDEHQFVGSLKMISDLTSIKSAQQRIEELGAFYSHILENIINGVWVTDSTDTLIYANKGFCDISGLSLEQLIGRHLDSFSPLAIKYFKPYYQSAKESLAPVQYYEIYVFTPLGRDSYQSGWIVPLTKDGCYDGMICTVEDSTEKKLARDLLQKTEQQYLALARTSTGLVRIDSDYAIMEANKPFWKMVGYTDAPLEQHSLLDFVATEDHDAVRDVFSQARGLGKYHNFELACRLPSDEERYLLFNIAVGDSPTDDSFYAVVRDITLRKTMEHDVLQQKEELSRFAHTVSHDLRNQIGIIRAYAELLVDECKDSSIPGRIKATTEKMTGFIERQLQLAEAGKAIGAYSTFDIRELVKELRQTYGVTIECESCCPLQGDRFRLEHMVVNLVQNAVTHGKATVVSIASTQTDEGFLLTVSDNGCGIDPRIQDTIFDMGVSTGGTGFGLPIVKHIVKAHNGTIDFMTDPAEGTTFNIFIPYAPC